MKMKLLTLITLLAATSLFVVAQEQTDPPTEEQLGLRGSEPTIRSEPSVSVPSDSSRTKYPAPGTPLATPRPKSTPKAALPQTSPSPGAVASVPPSATPSPSPRPATSPAAPAAKKKSAQAALREMENNWAAATSTHDIAAVQTLLAGDYVGVTAGGNIVNKAGLVAELRKDKNTYESVKNTRLDVRVHGTTAVVVGTTKQKGKDATGQPFSFTYRWTDTWVERDGQWQCVASQSLRLPG